MRKRTIWALLALTSTGLAAYGLGVQLETSAVAAPQQEEAQEDGGSAAPLMGPADGGATERQGAAVSEAEREACPTTPSAKLNMVMRELHAINQAEIEGGREAEQRAQAGEIKEYARLMVRDHTEADRRLSDYAKKNGLDLTKISPVDPIHAALDRADKAAEKALGTKRGAEFDTAYLVPQAMEHRVALSVVEEGQKYAKDDSKAFLDGMHRMLSDHLVRAQRLTDQLQFQPAAVGGGPGQDGGSATPQSSDSGAEQLGTDGGERKTVPPPVDGREEPNE